MKRVGGGYTGPGTPKLRLNGPTRRVLQLGFFPRRHTLGPSSAAIRSRTLQARVYQKPIRLVIPVSFSLFLSFRSLGNWGFFLPHIYTNSTCVGNDDAITRRLFFYGRTILLFLSGIWGGERRVGKFSCIEEKDL